MERLAPRTGLRLRWRWDLPPLPGRMGLLGRLLVLPLLGLLHAYRRWISPLFPPACRFEPSCSRYAIEALHVHAAPRALGLIGWRLLRCQPFCAGGHDPVPPRRATAGQGRLRPSAGES